MNLPDDHEEELVIDTADENREAAITLAGQARFSINIFTRDLDPPIFNNAAFEKCVFSLARQHRSATVRILARDSATAVRQGHSLIRLAQHLTSSVFIHNPAREHRDEPSTFMTVDGTGFIYRPRSSSRNYHAAVHARSPKRAAELEDYFNEMWERSTPDSQVRRLYI